MIFICLLPLVTASTGMETTTTTTTRQVKPNFNDATSGVAEDYAATTSTNTPMASIMEIGGSIEYYSAVAGLSSTPGSEDSRVMSKIHHPGQVCQQTSEELGVFSTADDCATAADKVEDLECIHFMFSKSYPGWGCRCCRSEGDDSGGKEHPLWDVFTVVPWDRINASAKVIERLMEPFATGGLGNAMKANKTLTRDLFHLHGQLLGFVNSNSVTAKDRHDVFEWYQSLAHRYPLYVHMQTFNEPLLDWLAGQIWVTMLEAGPQTKDYRTKVAEAINAEDDYKHMLVEYGVAIICNHKLKKKSTSFIRDLFDAVDPRGWSSVAFGVKDLLSDSSGTAAGIRQIRESGQNIFSDVWSWYNERAFPSDCEVCNAPSSNPSSPTFAVVVAHEVLGHNSLDQNKAALFKQELLDRKYKIIEGGAGPDIKFHSNSHFDKAATEKHFKTKGLMIESAGIDASMKEYFKGPGSFYEKNLLRSGVGYDYFINAPQEFYASFCNQYYTDSELTLFFAVERAKAGHLACLDTFLLAAYFLSDGGADLQFFRIEGYSAKVKRSQVYLHRNSKNISLV